MSNGVGDILVPDAPPEFSPKKLAIARHDARRDMYFFARWMLLREQRIKWIRAKHHDLIAQALDRVYRLETLRLIINLPPRYSKTAFVQAFIAWSLGRHPDSEYIYVSYNAHLAEGKSREIRDMVTSAEYREIFPDVRVRTDSSAVNHWMTTAGGVIHAAGSQGTITGFGAGKRREGFGGAVIIDDPLKPEDALLKERDEVNAWFPRTIENRLNSPHTPIILIAQRLHEQDLPGWLLDGGNGQTWEHLCLPALSDDGEPLWPAMHSLDDLKRLRDTNIYEFSAQYLQRPVPLGGAYFNERSLLVTVPGQDDIAPEARIVRPVEGVSGCTIVFAIVDTAVKTGANADGLAIVYFAYSRYFDANMDPSDPRREGRSSLTVLDWDYTQIEGAMLEVWLPTAIARVEEFAGACRALQGSAGVWIEDKAAGSVLLQQAANKGWHAHSIDSKLTSLGKSERAINISGYVHGDQVKFARQAYERVLTYKGRTRNHLLSQILSFNPTVKDQGEDDLLDCFSYGVSLGLGNAAGF